MLLYGMPASDTYDTENGNIAVPVGHRCFVLLVITAIEGAVIYEAKGRSISFSGRLLEALAKTLIALQKSTNFSAFSSILLLFSNFNS